MRTEVVGGAEGVSRAVAVLREGGLVGLPTETVYGLAGKALDGRVCGRIFEVKGRPKSDPLIVHVPDLGWLERVAEVSLEARRLAENFWPGPLTLVLPKRDLVPEVVTAGQGTVAVRMSAHGVFAGVVAGVGEPLAAPSANRFGRVSPTRAEHVLEELGGLIPLVLDGGATAHGIESTIVRVDGGRLRILRPGPVGREELEGFGEVEMAGGAKAGVVDPVVPGSFLRHYSPRTPLRLGWEPAPGKRSGLLAWREARDGFEAVEVLSPTGSVREGAMNLYAAMRRLDGLGLDEIVAELPPGGGVGDAILDRLRRAASRSDEGA